MGFFDAIKRLFQPVNQANLIHIYIQDKKCGEKIKILVRKSYDIQKIYEYGEEADYRLKKVVICNNCYNKINLTIDFDRRYNIINTEIDGGKIITENEYSEN
ncbi:MAG: hypothetical protein ACOC2J_00190 [bacterium]